jgi:hypothetical protein
MVFLNQALYKNIGIPKCQISGSFFVFLKKYFENMIEYYVLKQIEELSQIDVGVFPVQEDENIIQYILLITENPEKSRLIHDKIYGMLHHFAKFVVDMGKKCSFEMVIEIANSENISDDIVGLFLKPLEYFYIQKVSPKLICPVDAIYIHRETFYLYAEICCSNLWLNGTLSNTFKEHVYMYFFMFIQNFKNWLVSYPQLAENRLDFILHYISENYSEDLGKSMWNQILKYEESKQNWDNIHIYRIYTVPERFVDYCKVIIQYLLVEFIYTSMCRAESNEKKKIYTVDLFLGMQDAELLELPVFFKKTGSS